MESFHVWIRPLGEFCRIRVEDEDAARWLFSQLADVVGSESCQQLTLNPSGSYTFSVPYCSSLTREGLRQLLIDLPEVELMPQPA